MRAVDLGSKLSCQCCGFINAAAATELGCMWARGDLRGFTWQWSSAAAYVSGSEHARSGADYVRRRLGEEGKMSGGKKGSLRLKV